MQIDGKAVASEIKSKLKPRIQDLRTGNIVPKLGIITIGEESAWQSYVHQKVKVAGELGIQVVLIKLDTASEEKLLHTIQKIEDNKTFHGIIVQRPMPPTFNKNTIVNAVTPEKDIDGFRPDSKFEVPVWLAVKELVDRAMLETKETRYINDMNFAVIGKGETAGGPIIRGLKKLGFKVNIVDSQTQNRQEILKNADVVISCVGKANIISPDDIKHGAILIGVGTRGEDGKIKGDYDEEKVSTIAGAYTPTPGGVGPVNLSFLFSNLIQAAESQ